MTDIEKIIQILQVRKLSHLADLLVYSEGELSESSTYGNYLFSTLSKYYIKSPPDQTAKLESLSEQEKHQIYEAVLAVYPHKDNAPEITNIEFHISFEENSSLTDIKVAKLETLSIDIVQEQLRKCSQRIEENDFDGAVTTARAILETICKHILNINNYPFKDSEKLPELFKKVSKKLKMEPSLYKETPEFMEILSGFISVVKGIAAIRNEYSDAHGINPQKRYRIDRRHAILTVNAAKTVADYLMECVEK